jgi:hypothetical protein
MLKVKINFVFDKNHLSIVIFILNLITKTVDVDLKRSSETEKCCLYI